MRLTVLPGTEQTEVVVAENVTVKPELAVAAIENGGTPSVSLLNEPNVMVCGFFTAKLCVTGVATP
jgi:hypothetical protein